MELNSERDGGHGGTAPLTVEPPKAHVGRRDAGNNRSVDGHSTGVPAGQLASLERELHRARRAAEEARRTEARFLAIMNHEIRTPLNGVLGALQLLADTHPAPPQRELVDLARSSAESLRRVVNDVIDLSRLETGRLDLEPATFDIAALLDELRDVWRPIAASKGLTLQLTIDDTLPRQVCGDPVRIRQLVTHYVSNAIDYTERGGVRVKLGLDGGYSPGDGEDLGVCLEVSDTGPGIARDDQKRLFRDCGQVESANASRRAGAGIGLAICREIASQMGGSVGVSSTPGEGSTFWARLPLRAAGQGAEGDPPKTPDRLPPLSTADGAAPTLLLVEDSITNQMIAQAFLEQFGCRIDVANDGLEAVNAVKAKRYDIVLMDVAMPRMDGVEATRQIRALPGDAAQVPIVGQTAYALEEDSRTFLAAGMDQIVNKPLQREALHGALSRALAPATRATRPESTPGRVLRYVDTGLLGELEATLTPSQLGELLERVIDDIDVNGKAAIGAATRGEIERLARACHTLKGLGGSFASPELESVASRIQSACRNDDAQQATAIALSGLETVCENSLAELKAYLQAIGARQATLAT